MSTTVSPPFKFQKFVARNAPTPLPPNRRWKKTYTVGFVRSVRRPLLSSGLAFIFLRHFASGNSSGMDHWSGQVCKTKLSQCGYNASLIILTHPGVKRQPDETITDTFRNRTLAFFAAEFASHP